MSLIMFNYFIIISLKNENDDIFGKILVFITLF